MRGKLVSRPKRGRRCVAKLFLFFYFPAWQTRRRRPHSGSNQLCYNKPHTASVREHQPIRAYGNECESGSGSGMRAITSVNREDENLNRTGKGGGNNRGQNREKVRVPWSRSHWWRGSNLRCDIYFRPSSWGAWESTKTTSWMQTEREGREREEGSCHKMWETLLWLIRVNETVQNERVPIHGKSQIHKFNGRSDRGRARVEPAGEIITACPVSGSIQRLTWAL